VWWVRSVVSSESRSEAGQQHEEKFHRRSSAQRRRLESGKATAHLTTQVSRPFFCRPRNPRHAGELSGRACI
jgi:hypothetical protein